MQPGAASTRLRMAPADAAWLHKDEPDNPADVVLLMTFDASPTVEAVKATAAERLLRFERFRQRVVEMRGRPYWEIDGDFQLDNHVVGHDLDSRLTEEKLREVVSDLATRPPEPERPLWSLHLVRGTAGGGALVLRVHHCIADGLALAHAVSFSEQRGEASRAAVGDTRGAASVVTRAGDRARSLGRLLRIPWGREIVLRRPLTGRRRLAWSMGYSLEIAKAVARSRDVTLNDLFLAALTGTLRRFLAETGELVRGRSIRAIVPVNLRPARRVEDVGESLGNRFGLFFIGLPAEERGAQARLEKLGERIRTGDRLGEAWATLEILKAFGRGPASLDRFVSRFMTRKASVVLSSVPGPRGPVYFGGRRIRDVMFWEPHPGRLGLALSILTYDGTVRMGARADEGITDDPSRLVAWFEEEWSVLLEG
jgi:diacylglycerol O-acyltransferase